MKRIKNCCDHLFGLIYKGEGKKRKKRENEELTLTFEGRQWTAPGAVASKLIVDRTSTLDTIFKWKRKGRRTVTLDVCEAEELMLLLVEHSRRTGYQFFQGKKRYL